MGQVPLTHPADDPFQEGEYLTWSPTHTQAVLIHGGLDTWPAQTACSPGHRILCARAVNTGLQLLALILLAALLRAVLGTDAPALLAMLPSLLLLAGIGGAAGSPIALHQGTPGLRDIAMLGGLLLMAQAARRLDHGAPALPTFAALAALAALAPLWAYNRGLALILVAGLFTLAASLAHRTPRPILAAAAGGFAALAAALASGLAPLFAQTAADIAYWSRNAALWHSTGAFGAKAITLALHAAGLAAAAAAALPAWRAGRRAPALIALALAATGALYLLQALDRPDAIHLRWTLWPATALIGLGLAHALRARPVPAAAGLAAATLLTAAATYRLADTSPDRWRFLPGLLANTRLLRGPLPTDRDLAGPDLVAVADQVRAAGGCTFAADNAGLVHLLSGRPPCSRFAYGSYIAPAEQDGVIAELAAAAPPLILWDAQAWWAHIDGRGFATNTPALATWIADRYPVQTVIGIHTLRSMRPLAPLTPPAAGHSRASDAAAATTTR